MSFTCLHNDKIYMCSNKSIIMDRHARLFMLYVPIHNTYKIDIHYMHIMRLYSHQKMVNCNKKNVIVCNSISFHKVYEM